MNVVYKDTQDELPPFVPQEMIDKMNEARARVRKLSSHFSDVWSWGSQNCKNLVIAIDKTKAEFKNAFEAQDTAMCYKWIYYMERCSKQIINKYKEAKKLT